MKRILFSLMMLAAVLSVAGVGSLAYFSDSEASDGNTFTAGTWGTDVGTGEIAVADPDVGDTGTETWTVTNPNTVPEYLDLENIILAETGDGQLGENLMVHLFVDWDGNGSFDGGDATIYGSDDFTVAINGIDSSYDMNLLLEGGETTYITLNWKVSDAYAPCEGDSIALTITFELELWPED